MQQKCKKHEWMLLTDKMIIHLMRWSDSDIMPLLLCIVHILLFELDKWPSTKGNNKPKSKLQLYNARMIMELEKHYKTWSTVLSKAEENDSISCLYVQWCIFIWIVVKRRMCCVIIMLFTVKLLYENIFVWRCVRYRQLNMFHCMATHLMLTHVACTMW
jgi:hypothetical protein